MEFDRNICLEQVELINSICNSNIVSHNEHEILRFIVFILCGNVFDYVYPDVLMVVKYECINISKDNEEGISLFHKVNTTMAKVILGNSRVKDIEEYAYILNGYIKDLKV